MFVIWEKLIQQILKKNVVYCYKKKSKPSKNCFLKKQFIKKLKKTTKELIGNKIAEKFVKRKPMLEANSRNFDKMVIQTRNSNRFKTNIEKWNKISELLNCSSASKFVTRNGLK